MTNVKLVFSDLPKPGEFEWEYDENKKRYFFEIGILTFRVDMCKVIMDRWADIISYKVDCFMPYLSSETSISIGGSIGFDKYKEFESSAEAKNFIEAWLWEHAELEQCKHRDSTCEWVGCSKGDQLCFDSKEKSMSKEFKLKPCPFCGKTDKTFVDIDECGGYGTLYTPCCSRCGLQINGSNSLKKSIKKWNTRKYETGSED